MTTVDLLARLGARPVPIDRDPAYPFAMGSTHATCPRCGRYASIVVDRDGRWQAACRCWGRPWSVHDALDLVLAAAA